MKFNTKVIHGNQKNDASTGAVMTPIYQSSTFAHESLENHSEYSYSRTSNPTRKALEDSMASIENGKFGIAFGSGLAAIDAVLKLLKPGDEVISCDDLYGGTYRIFTQVYSKYQIKFKFIDLNSISELESNINSNTKMLWVESPTNPLLNILDIHSIGNITKKHNLIFAVDNTFASPYLQKPLDYGADIIIHSATKYLGGHSDVVLGALVLNDKDLAKQLYFIQNSCGAICGPMDSYLTLRGIKTLHLRMQRHCENTEKVAVFLKAHPKIDKVYWPGFKDHKNHLIAKKQMDNFGGMVSFSLKQDTFENANIVLKNLNLFTLAESLGGVESLCGHPATMTHGSIPKDKRNELGITDSLIRLSVGIEDHTDLIEDLQKALEKLT